MFRTRPPSRSRYTAIILAAVLGTLVTVGAFLLVCSWEYRVATIDFQSRAKSYLEFMNADLSEASAVMRSIAAFIGSNDHAVSADEFARFSAASREQLSALRDTAWAPRVTLAERPTFERDARTAGIVGYQIKQFGDHGRLFRARPRAEYYALLYNEPERAAEDSLIGLDLVFEKRRAAAARRALQTGRPAATPPIDVLTVKQRGAGVLSYMPVYHSRDGSRDGLRAARGLVLGVFDIPVFVAGILARHTTLDGLDLYLFNPRGAADRRMIYRTASLPRSESPPSERALIEGTHWQSTVFMIDQRLGAIVTPKVPLHLLRWTLFGMTTLIVGFIMTAMSVAYLFTLLQRALQLEAITEEVTRISLHDALTGMPNRLFFQQRMDQSVASFTPGAPFALLFLDLDRFKAVNDSFGHAMGDRLLCAVAGRIADCIRKGDTAARLGGDEFAIILADSVDPALISIVANRLVASVGAPYTFDETPIHIGVSIGAVIASESATVDTILAEADFAMYEAKEAGRGTYRLFEKSGTAATDDKLRGGNFLQRSSAEAPADHSVPSIGLAPG